MSGAARTRFSRNFLVYGLTVAVQRAASFVLLPVYTRVLTPADYGALQLLQISLDVVSIALTAGTTAGVMRFYFKEKEDPRARGRVVLTAWWLLLGFNALAALLLVAAAPWIAAEVVERPGEAQLVYLLALGFALEPAAMVPLLLVQAEGRAGLYSALSVSRLALQIALNLLFLLVFDWGVAGVLASNAFTNGLIGLVASGWLVRRAGILPGRGLAWDLLRFGLPYRVTQVGAFILTFADRYFLKGSRGVAEVGVYGLAYQFGFLLIMTSAMPYMQAWTPQRFALLSAPAAERDAAHDVGFRHFSLVVLTVGLGIALLARPVLEVMSSEGFHGAADLVPVIVAAYVFQAWSDVVEFGIQVSEQTRYATYSTWTAVVVVVVLYVGLIPPFGGMGAAVATLVAFAVRFGCSYTWSQRLYPLPYRWGPPLRVVALALVACALSFAWRMQPWPAQLAGAIGALGAYAALVLAWTRIVTPSEQRAVWRWVAERAHLRAPSENA